MNSPRACPRPSRTVYNVAQKKAFAALCNCWRCRRCGGRKRDKLVRRARSLRADGMLTTTISDRAAGGVDARSLDAVAFLQERERVFRRHIARVLGGFAYLWVIEVGEQGGRVHRHYLVRWRRRAIVSGFRRGWLPSWVLVRLQDFAKSARLGRIDWKPIANEETAARYVSKYVAKTIGELGEGLPVRFRRFGSNEHYEEPKEPGWRSVGFSLAVVLRLLDSTLLGPPTRLYWLLSEDMLGRYIPRHPPPEQILSLPRAACERRSSMILLCPSCGAEILQRVGASKSSAIPARDVDKHAHEAEMRSLRASIAGIARAYTADRDSLGRFLSRKL